MINITVNGNKEQIPIMTIFEYLEKRNLAKSSIVIELNEKIIKKDELNNCILNENDKIEIIRFVGGG